MVATTNQPELTRTATMVTATRITTPSATVTTSDWKAGLPVLTGTGFTLRELRPVIARRLAKPPQAGMLRCRRA